MGPGHRRGRGKVAFMEVQRTKGLGSEAAFFLSTFLSHPVHFSFLYFSYLAVNSLSKVIVFSISVIYFTSFIIFFCLKEGASQWQVNVEKSIWAIHGGLC